MLLARIINLLGTSPIFQFISIKNFANIVTSTISSLFLHLCQFSATDCWPVAKPTKPILGLVIAVPHFQYQFIYQLSILHIQQFYYLVPKNQNYSICVLHCEPAIWDELSSVFFLLVFPDTIYVPGLTRAMSPR